MSTQGLEPRAMDSGFQFAGERVEVADQIATRDTAPEANVLFDVADKARLYAKVLGDLGMVVDADRAGETIRASMQELHDVLEKDRLPEDEDVMPFFAIDLPDRPDSLAEGIKAFSDQSPDTPKVFAHPDLYRLSPRQLNRRSFLGETEIKGWGARAMLLGGIEAAPGLLFTDMTAAEQVEGFGRLRSSYDDSHPSSGLGLLNLADHLVITAAMREENESSGIEEPLLDQGCHFVPHKWVSAATGKSGDRIGYQVTCNFLQAGNDIAANASSEAEAVPVATSMSGEFADGGRYWWQFIPSAHVQYVNWSEKSGPAKTWVENGSRVLYHPNAAEGIRVSAGPK